MSDGKCIQCRKPIRDGDIFDRTCFGWMHPTCRTEYNRPSRTPRAFYSDLRESEWQEACNPNEGSK
jgi:hypothetical protein